MKAPELAILGTVKRDGDAEVLSLKRPGLAMIWLDKPEAQGVIVGCSMKEQKVFLQGLVAYGACLDVMMGMDEAKRNKLLSRLHLFDGKLRLDKIWHVSTRAVAHVLTLLIMFGQKRLTHSGHPFAGDQCFCSGIGSYGKL